MNAAGVRDCRFGFHSISFPSEWGLFFLKGRIPPDRESFHSISFPSEWGLGSPTHGR